MMLKRGDILKLEYERYGEKREIDGLVAKMYNSGMMKILIPVPTAGSERTTMLVDTNSIVSVSPSALPVDVQKALRELAAAVNKQEELEYNIAQLKKKARQQYDLIKDMESDLAGLFASLSDDDSAWKAKIAADLKPLSGPRWGPFHADIEDVNIKEGFVLISIKLVREVKLFAKSIEERTLRGQEVTSEHIANYAPYLTEKEMWSDYPNAKLLKSERKGKHMDKGFVSFWQATLTKVDLDINNYSKWLKEIKEAIGKIKRLHRERYES